MNSLVLKTSESVVSFVFFFPFFSVEICFLNKVGSMSLAYLTEIQMLGIVVYSLALVQIQIIYKKKKHFVCFSTENMKSKYQLFLFYPSLKALTDGISEVH